MGSTYKRSSHWTEIIHYLANRALGTVVPELAHPVKDSYLTKYSLQLLQDRTPERTERAAAYGETAVEQSSFPDRTTATSMPRWKSISRCGLHLTASPHQSRFFPPAGQQHVGRANTGAVKEQESEGGAESNCSIQIIPSSNSDCPHVPGGSEE